MTANARKDQIMMSMNVGMVSLPQFILLVSKSVGDADALQDDVTTEPYRMQDMLKQIEKLVAKYTSLSVSDS